MRIRLQHKIIVIIVAVVVSTFLWVYIYLNKNLKQETYSRIQEHLFKELQLSKSYLEISHPGNLSVKQYDEIADRIGQLLNLRVTIVNLKGDVLGDSSLTPELIKSVDNHLYRPEIQDAIKFEQGKSRRFSQTVKMDMLYMAEPFGMDERQGVIRLSIPLSDIKDVSGIIKRHLMVALLFAFFAAVILGAILSFFVTRPIVKISSVAKKIASGDYSGKLVLSGDREIFELAESVNFMSAQIYNRMNEIESNRIRLEAIFLNMFEGVMIIDQDGKIILMNQTLQKFFHVQGEYAGKKPLEVVRNIQMQEMADAILNSSHGVESKEISIFSPEEITMQVNATSVVRNGQLEGAVLVFHDMTELRRLENIRKDFVANVSHELRTPITNIKGYAETLLDGALEDKKNARDFVNIIFADANRLNQLVNDLLDLSKIESGQVKLSLQPIDVGPILDNVISGLLMLAKGKNIVIQNNLTKQLSQVMGDEINIAQLFLNLIENAIKYSNENGTITIEAEDEKDRVRFNVKDTGIGIPQQDLPRIFERFYRVDKARSRDLGGTGLGLSIAKHIVQSHGGELTVASELNKGSTFSFALKAVSDKR